MFVGRVVGSGKAANVMGRSTEKLRALNVERLSSTPGLYSDGGGLNLRVSSPTARSWVFRYMLAGKAREMGLGSYPEVSLADAREAALAARKLKTLGKDPIAEREAARAAERAEAARAVTFQYCAKAYISARKPSWRNEKHGNQWAATLNTYAMPLIGDLPVQAVDVAMVHRILEPIWSRKPETASRLRGRIEAVLDWAATRGYRSGENPARWKGHIENLFPAHSKLRTVKHHAALPYAEINAFVASLRLDEGVAAVALEFAILTAARTGEILGAVWDEIDFANTVWTVSADRMKGGREHRVPLSAPAMAILKSQHKSTNGRGFIFPGSKEGKPLSNMAMLQTLRRMQRDDLTVHGFRSTFRDWAAERTGYPREVAEAALAHSIEDKVEAAYRRSDLFDKRRKLMNSWADFCGVVAKDAKVVVLRKSVEL